MSTDDTTSEDNAHPYETEDSFHPMGEEWEERMREQLEETEFDADLGMQMARDAQRLVAGELTEQEFYAEYHEDVSEEFDVDERPVLDDLDIDDPAEIDDGGSLLSSLGDVDLETDGATRRDVMKKMGAGAAFLGYGAYASYDNQQGEVPEDISGITHPGEDERENRWGMVIDLERCDGCLACVAGCVDENGTSTGANWMYVFPYQNEESEQQNFLVRPCQHCSNAPCAKVCPVRARHTRSKDGIVLTDYETCIGCRYCQVACPYGVNYFQWGDPDVPMGEIEHLDMTPGQVRDLDEEERHQQLSEANDHIYDERGKWVDSRPPQGVMGKCTFCPSRQDEHTDNPRGTVACMDACDTQGMSAIHFGDLDDPESRPNRHLRQRSENQFEDGASQFEADLSFEAGGGDTAEASIDVDGGIYPLYFVEKPAEREDWRVLDSASTVVAGSGEAVPGSEEFAESTIADIGGVPAGETDLLVTDTQTDIDVTVVFDDDEFEDATERDIDISLRLVGQASETVATGTVTLREEQDVVGRQLRRGRTFTVDGAELGVPENEGYALLLLVEEETDEGVETRLADSRRVFVADGTPDSQQPEPPYDDSRLDGSLDAVPDVLFKGATTAIEATVRYPNRPRTYEKRLVLDDGSIQGVGETGDTIAQMEYEFTQQRTSNTPWNGKLSTFRLLENMGTEPNVIYLGNEPDPEDEQVEGPVAYEDISSSEWGQWMEIKSERKEHLDYGAGARRQTGENP